MLAQQRLYISQLLRSWWRWPRLFWEQNWLSKVGSIVVIVIVVVFGSMYGIARWYIASEQSKPLKEGVSFIPDYAQSLGVDPQAAMDGLTGIGVKHFRLVSYWSDMEQTPGQYDFSQLDWQFKKAEAANAKVSLALGLRQPRWPECHMPDWANKEPASQWQPQLEKYMAAVVNRYKDSPALDSYQVENEFFLKGFGECETIPHSMDRDRLVAEYNLVKQLDPHHTVIVNRSNNAIGWPAGRPQPDEFGISVYKRVWSPVVGRYMEYPIPAWYYGFLAGWQKIFLGKDMIIHELQAEAWAPHGKSLQDISLAEQNKSLNAKRLQDRFGYGKATGMREMYLWGSEYWYYRLVALHDPSLWNVAKQEFSASQ
jgi:hypothetical protein